MKKIDLGQTINTLANLGVLVGIVFLAVEIGQNQESLERANDISLAAARDATLETFINRGYVIVQDEELTRIQMSGNRGEELDELDEARYQSLCGSRIWLHAVTYERATRLEWNEIANAAVQDLGTSISDNPGIQQCWDRLKGGLASWDHGDFVTAVDTSDR
jgi:hypothetical protein